MTKKSKKIKRMAVKIRAKTKPKSKTQVKGKAKAKAKRKARDFKIMKKKKPKKSTGPAKTHKSFVVAKTVKRKKRVQKDEGVIRQTKIKVIGIGGGGGSVVSEIAARLKKVDFVAANTDLQALKKISRECKPFQFGRDLTQGLGCGMNSDTGRKAAELEKEKIKKVIEGADFCILVSCLGGGTGSGASSVFTEVAKEFNNVCFGIFTLPFKFEGEKKAKIALNALEKLKPNLNALTVIPNEKIFQIIDKNTSLERALSSLNKILEQGLEGLIEMIYLPGLINIDWADFKTILEGKGKLCYLNSVEERREKGAEELVRQLLQSPLSEYDIRGAEKILYNIASDKDLKMETVEQISKSITRCNPKAKIIFGISQHPKYKGKIWITLLATGCGEAEKKPGLQRKAKKKSEKPEQKPEAPQAPSITSNKEKEEIEEKKQVPSSGAERAVPVPAKEQDKIKRPLPAKKLFSKNKKTKIRRDEKPKTPLLLPEDTTIRKNALDLKKEAERLEKEILEEEKKWDTPAFLRNKNT